MGLRKIRPSDLIDCIFPRLKRKNAQAESDDKARRATARAEEEKLVAGLPSDEEQLKEHLESVEKIAEKEQSRLESVNARLMSIVGLTSIAATVVLTALFAMAAGTMPLHQSVAKWTLVPGCFYLTLQLYAALYAAIKGLSRAPYIYETAVDLLPSAQLAGSDFLRHRISQKLEMLEQHQDVNNEKVGQMAVAHRAVINFLFALVILAAVASLMALNREPPKDSVVCSEVLNKLCAAQENSVTNAPLAPRGGEQKPVPEKDGFSSKEMQTSPAKPPALPSITNYPKRKPVLPGH